MGLDGIKNQLVSELPLSASTIQRDAQKPTPKPEDGGSVTDLKRSESEKGREQKGTQLSQEETEVLQQQIESLNTQLSSSALRFEFVEELGASVIKVVDVADNKTIRQIPSEEMIERLKEIRAYLEQRVYGHTNTSQYQDQLKDAISGILLNQSS